jgi:hypothetical protein
MGRAYLVNVYMYLYKKSYFYNKKSLGRKLHTLSLYEYFLFTYGFFLGISYFYKGEITLHKILMCKQVSFYSSTTFVNLVYLTFIVTEQWSFIFIYFLLYIKILNSLIIDAHINFVVILI